MKVLFVTPYLPVPPDFGGARRMFELIRGSSAFHEVLTLSLAGYSDDVSGASAQIGPLQIVRVPVTARGNATRSRRMLQLRSLASPHSSQFHLYHHTGFQTALDRLIVAESVDLVQLEFSQMGSYRVGSNTPTVLDVHNVEHDLLRQMASTGSAARRLFNLIEYRKFRREEVENWQSATCCVATSRNDATIIERRTGRDVPVIPNGVDLDFFRRAPQSAIEPGHIVFTGAMRYRPNAEAATFFVHNILPLIRREFETVRFSIVGADPPSEVRELTEIPGVSVTGTVSDVRPWLDSAQVVVVPLHTGGGTRLKDTGGVRDRSSSCFHNYRCHRNRGS